MTEEKRLKPDWSEMFSQRFRSAAQDHGEATLSWNARRANAAFRKLKLLFAKNDVSQEHVKNAVLVLMQSDVDPSTKTWAAAIALSFAPDDALSALRDVVASSPNILGFNAKMTLKLWNEGKWRSPFASAEPA